MARIAGIKEHKTASGKVKAITIDLKKWGSYLEDFLDMVDVERVRKNNDFIEWEAVKKQLLKSKK